MNGGGGRPGCVVPSLRTSPQTSPCHLGSALGGAGLEAESCRGCSEHPGKRRLSPQGQDGERPRGRGQRGCVSPGSVLGVPI